MKRKSSFKRLHVFLVLVLFYGFLTGACAGQQEQPVIALTDLDFNNDGFINQINYGLAKK